MKEIRNTVAIIGVFLLVFFNLSCNRSEKRQALELLESNPVDVETLRLRKAQMVRVVDFPIGGEQSGRQVRLVDGEQFRTLVQRYCTDQLDVCSDYRPVCGACEATQELCMAHTYLDLAGIRSEPLRLTNLGSIEVVVVDPSGEIVVDQGGNVVTELVTVDEWEIGAQSNATNAQLSELAMTSAIGTMFVSGGYLAQNAGIEYGEPGQLAESCLSSDLSESLQDPPPSQQIQPTIAQNLASNYVEAYQILWDAGFTAADNIVAAADAQLGHPSPRVGRENSYKGPELSRLAAARRLVGTPGASTASVAGLCSISPPSGPTLVALDAIRQSGLPPDILLDDTVDVESLINGPLTGELSVRERLAELWERPELLEPNAELISSLAVEPSHFAEALQYLRQEHAVFARTDQVLAPPPQGIELSFDRYASIVNPPAPLNPSYFVTEAYDIQRIPKGVDDVNRPIPLETGQSAVAMSQENWFLAEQADAALYLAADILSRTELDQEVRALISDLFGALLVQGSTERRGRLQLCEPIPGDLYTRATVWGFSPTDGVALVRGEDGLNCAIHGQVDGITCTREQLGITTLADGGVASPSIYAVSLLNLGPDDVSTFPSLPQQARAGRVVPDYNTVAWNAVDPNVIGLEFDAKLYFVVPRPGATPGVPGAYQALGGFTRTLSFGIGGLEACQTQSVFPLLSQRTFELLAPSTDSCDHAAVECDGTRFDARIPLEDELTQDFDGVESSWRHYLNLARQAAQESDLLGQQYIQQAIDLDVRQADRREAQLQRAELALDELQQICGTSIDSRILLEKITGPNLELTGALTGEACQDDLDCMGTNEECLAGRCIQSLESILRDNAGDPDLARIAECIDGSTEDNYVAMGSEPVCFWRRSNNPNYVCEDPNPDDEFGGPCPVQCSLLDQGLYPNWLPLSPSPPADNFTFEEVRLDNNSQPKQLLGYFDAKVSAPPEESRQVCEVLKRLRDEPNEDLAARVARSNLLTPSIVRNAAQSLGWRAAIGGYSSIHRGEQLLFQTGHPAHGPASQGWPCTTPQRQNCTSESKSLFCMVDQSNCLENEERARTNQRMLNAVLAARATTTLYEKGILPGIWLPFYMFVDTRREIGQGDLWGGGNFGRISRAIDNRRYRVLPLPEAARGDFPLNPVLQQALDDEPPRGIVFSAWHDFQDGQSLNSTVWWQEQTDGSVRAYPGFPVVLLAPSSLPIQWEFGIGEIGSVGWDQHTAFASVVEQTALVGQTAGGLVGAADSIDPMIFWADMSDDSRYLSGSGNPASNQRAWGAIFKLLAGSSVVGSTSGFQGPSQRVPTLWENEAFSNGCFDGTPDQNGVDCNLNMNFTELTRFRNAETESGSGISAFGIPVQFPYTSSSILDGAELICESVHGGEAGCDGPAPEILTNSDLSKAKDYLECVGEEIKRRASLAVFAHVPERAIDALRKDSIIGSFPAAGGDFGVALTQLRTALIDASEAAPLIADNLRGLGRDIDQVRLGLEREGLGQRINDVQFRATVSNQLANCASAVGGAVSSFGSGNPLAAFGGGLSAAATCLNSTAQINYGREIRSLQAQITEVGKQQLVNSFVDSFESRAETLRALAVRITRAQETIDGSLAQLENLQNRAKRALVKALTLDSRELEVQYRINSAMRTRLNTSRIRYEDSRRAAVRMAFLAKRSIEARLGLRLADLGDDLPLVEAPSTWESTICTSTGVDYASLSEAAADDIDDEEVVANYADAFVGDYVNRLERVIESYRLVNNFHEGTDTAVISLRDDVLRVRALCETEVSNLLYEAGQLDVTPTEVLFVDEASENGDPNDILVEKGWSILGCDPAEPITDPQDAEACIQVQELPTSDAPFEADSSNPSAVTSFRITFGDEVEGQTCTEDACRAKPGSAIVQRQRLHGGRFRLSWYARPPVDPMDDPNLTAVTARDAGGSEFPRPGALLVEPQESFWNRYSFQFDVEEPQLVEVAVVPEPSMLDPHHRDIAALMLEDIDVANVPLDESPAAFANTSQTLTRMLPTCEDTDGVVFRSQGWRSAAIRLCSDGFASECSGETADTFPFRETSFHISQRDIEANRIFRSSGFARGNFNYRIESIGVNFVGSNTRDCADSDNPSTCHSAGFVPYTLIHNGPYVVRNHAGEDFEVGLFTAKIEHARGLGAERYFTNPISGSDQELLSQYLRTEFQGRPLDGNFVLRVWDEPGVNFAGIDDVQIILNYRYWTRFD